MVRISSGNVFCFQYTYKYIIVGRLSDSIFNAILLNALQLFRWKRDMGLLLFCIDIVEGKIVS